MILFFGMQLIPLTYGMLYVIHSFKTKRRGQGIAAGVLLFVLAAALAVLLWEFLAVP